MFPGRGADFGAVGDAYSQVSAILLPGFGHVVRERQRLELMRDEPGAAAPGTVVDLENNVVRVTVPTPQDAAVTVSASGPQDADSPQDDTDGRRQSRRR